MSVSLEELNIINFYDAVGSNPFDWVSVLNRGSIYAESQGFGGYTNPLTTLTFSVGMFGVGMYTFPVLGASPSMEGFIYKLSSKISLGAVDATHGDLIFRNYLEIWNNVSGADNEAMKIVDMSSEYVVSNVLLSDISGEQYLNMTRTVGGADLDLFWTTGTEIIAVRP